MVIQSLELMPIHREHRLCLFIFPRLEVLQLEGLEIEAWQEENGCLFWLIQSLPLLRLGLRLIFAAFNFLELVFVMMASGLDPFAFSVIHDRLLSSLRKTLIFVRSIGTNAMAIFTRLALKSMSKWRVGWIILI